MAKLFGLFGDIEKKIKFECFVRKIDNKDGAVQNCEIIIESL